METIIYTATLTTKKIINTVEPFRFTQQMHFKSLESAMNHAEHWNSTQELDVDFKLIGKNDHYYGTGYDCNDQFVTLEVCQTLLFD